MERLLIHLLWLNNPTGQSKRDQNCWRRIIKVERPSPSLGDSIQTSILETLDFGRYLSSRSSIIVYNIPSLSTQKQSIIPSPKGSVSVDSGIKVLFQSLFLLHSIDFYGWYKSKWWENEGKFWIENFHHLGFEIIKNCTLATHKNLWFSWFEFLNFYLFVYLFWIFGSKESGRGNVEIKMWFSFIFLQFLGNEIEGWISHWLLLLEVFNYRVSLWTAVEQLLVWIRLTVQGMFSCIKNRFSLDIEKILKWQLKFCIVRFSTTMIWIIRFSNQ